MTTDKLPQTTAPLCPHCGIAMRKRHGRFGFFWGCPNYPRCPFTLDYPDGKLSVSQKDFLTKLNAIEDLCKSYSSKISKGTNESEIQSLLVSFENEFTTAKKSIATYFQRQKYFSMQEYINTLAGLVYYTGATTLCSLNALTEALRINGIAQGLIYSTDANAEKLHNLDTYIRRKMQQPDSILPPPNNHITVTRSNPPPPRNGYIDISSKPHSYSFIKFKYLALCIVILVAFFSRGFGLLSPSPVKPNATPRTTQSAPVKSQPASSKSSSTSSKSLHPEFAAPAKASSATSNSYTRRSQSISNTNPGDQNPITTAYVGNKRTGVFHRAGCRAERRMSERNRLYFDNRNELINRGFRPCQICNP